MESRDMNSNEFWSSVNTKMGGEESNLFCPLCSALSFVPFFELNAVPLQDGLLFNTKKEAMNALTGDIKLAFCNNCSYIGNISYTSEKIRYDQEYNFSLHFSPIYKEFIKDLTIRLVNKYDLRHKKVLEIGCGQGDFLRELCVLGENTGIGIDPSIRSKVEAAGTKQITYIKDFYSETYADIENDFICCRQVLDQLSNPRKFIELVRHNIGNHLDTIVYFEVPNASNIFKDLQIRNIIYEKSSWFIPYSLSQLFQLCGFKVLSIEPCYEAGQYLSIEAIPVLEGKNHQTIRTNGVSNEKTIETFGKVITDFGESYKQKKETWKEQLAIVSEAGKSVIAWGAGSGAITFFNMLKITDQIQYVIDINPKRQGKFLPLTGQEVVPPEFLQVTHPDIVIITNSTYEQEIKQQITNLGVSCDFWVI